MLHTAVVPVNRTPIFKLFGVSQCLVVVGVDVTQEIPGRACPLRHCVCLSLCVCATLRALAIYERVNLCKWAFAVLTGLKILNLRQFKRKLVIGNGNHSALGAVNNRNRLAPITLTVKRPVLHLVLNALFADAHFFKVLNHLCD